MGAFFWIRTCAWCTKLADTREPRTIPCRFPRRDNPRRRAAGGMRAIHCEAASIPRRREIRFECSSLPAPECETPNRPWVDCSDPRAQGTARRFQAHGRSWRPPPFPCVVVRCKDGFDSCQSLPLSFHERRAQMDTNSRIHFRHPVADERQPIQTAPGHAAPPDYVPHMW